VNGPEHYKLAEDILSDVRNAAPGQSFAALTHALVHAVLAVAAAVAPNGGYFNWDEVTLSPEPPPYSAPGEK
jgi:hypothetical protein